MCIVAVPAALADPDGDLGDAELSALCAGRSASWLPPLRSAEPWPRPASSAWWLRDVRCRQLSKGRVALCGDAGTAFLPTAGVAPRSPCAQLPPSATSSRGAPWWPPWRSSSTRMHGRPHALTSETRASSPGRCSSRTAPSPGAREADPPYAGAGDDRLDPGRDAPAGVSSGAGGRNGARCPTDSSRSPRSSIGRKPLETVPHVVQTSSRFVLITRRSQVRILPPL